MPYDVEWNIASKRIFADFSLFALKMVMVLNGGALIALLAFMKSGADGKDPLMQAIAGAIPIFLVGLLVGVVAGSMACLHTYSAAKIAHKGSDETAVVHSTTFAATFGLAFVSLVLFAGAAFMLSADIVALSGS